MTQSDLTIRHYPESAFGGFTGADGSIAFYARVNALARPEHVVLDVGCGRGAGEEDPVPFRRQLRFLQGRVARVIGIDLDPAAAGNPRIDEFRPITGSRWPVDDATIDLLLADWVLEHVPDPGAFLGEARRVLRPGGHLCMRTTNVASYVGLASRLVGNRAHVRVLSRAQPDRAAEDVFPAVYRCNTVGKLRRALARAGFQAAVYGFDSEPQYLGFSGLAFRLGVWHQRLAPRRFAPTLFAFARRPADQGPAGARPTAQRAGRATGRVR